MVFSSIENSIITTALVTALKLPFGSAPCSPAQRQRLEAVELMVAPAWFAAEVYELSEILSDHLRSMDRRTWQIDTRQICKAADGRYKIGTVESAARLMGGTQLSENPKLYATNPSAQMPVTKFFESLFKDEE